MPQSCKTYRSWNFIGCRHGLALIINNSRCETVLWDPLTGQQYRVKFPPGFNNRVMMFCHAAVLCADAEDGHVHGDCFSSPFRLVLLGEGYTHASACLYESASGVWGDIVSMRTTKMISYIKPNVLVGNALYWLFSGGDILEFDFQRQHFGLIKKPADDHINYYSYRSVQLLRTADSGLWPRVFVTTNHPVMGEEI